MSRIAPACLFLALLTSPAFATHPGLLVPAWIEVSVSLPRTPEVGQQFPVHANVRLLVGKLENAPFQFRLPAGMEAVSGEANGSLTLAAGQSRELSIEAKLHQPAPDASAGFDVVAPLPREALLAEIERVYAGKPPEDIDAVRRALDRLKGPQTVSGMATFSATEEEGLGSSAEPAFLRYFRPPNAAGDRRFAMLAPSREPEENAQAAAPKPGAVRELFAQNPKLAELFRKAGRDPELLASRQDAGDYSRALRGLEAGKVSEALESFGTQAKDPARPGSVRFAAANGEAVALFVSNHPEKAEEAWRRLSEQNGAGALAGYAHFNLGEALSSRGQLAEAAAEYRKALELRPAYTLARRRLDQH